MGARTRLIAFFVVAAAVIVVVAGLPGSGAADAADALAAATRDRARWLTTAVEQPVDRLRGARVPFAVRAAHEE